MAFWIRSSNMPRSIVPATMLFICRLTTWQSAEPDGGAFGFELDATGEALDDGRLPDTGLTDEHDGIRTLAVAENLEHLLDPGFAAEHRRRPILPRQQVQVGRELL